MGRLVASVTNKHDGKRYTVSTVREPGRETWETVAFRGWGYTLRRVIGAVSMSERKQTTSMATC